MINYMIALSFLVGFYFIAMPHLILFFLDAQYEKKISKRFQLLNPKLNIFSLKEEMMEEGKNWSPIFIWYGPKILCLVSNANLHQLMTHELQASIHIDLFWPGKVMNFFLMKVFKKMSAQFLMNTTINTNNPKESRK